MTPVTIVAPDAGAEKRCSKVANTFNQKLATATKHRTPEGITIKMNTNDISERVVIIDDICDGGRTFIELAKVLKGEYGVKHVTLIVTHGIFSAGMRVFDGLIDEIRCYNDISKDTRSLMNVVKNSTKLFGR
jgi:ribose-phosphate pyrophosphokinase